MRIAILQWDISSDYKKNIQIVTELSQKTAKHQPHFIALPEMWATDFNIVATDPHWDEMHDEIISTLKSLAKNIDCYIVGGSIQEKVEDKTYNTALLVTPQGKIHWQRKIHLFKEISEDKNFTAGEEIKAISTPHGKIGMAICYDLRFPEMFRALALQGAQVIFVPAQFPSPRELHWETLLRARAIENQIFIVGINRTGSSRGLEFFGKSAAFAPNGELIHMATAKSGALVIELNMKMCDKVRESVYYLEDCRPSVYNKAGSKGDQE
ncbi:MAG: nitrilase-related carbon-nitrogen hydrolase [bacterium]